MVIHADPILDAAPDSGEELRARLGHKIARFEAAYGIASSDLRAALASGEVRETLEVCDWLIAWEALDALGRGGPARLE